MTSSQKNAARKRGGVGHTRRGWGDEDSHLYQSGGLGSNTYFVMAEKKKKSEPRAYREKGWAF